MTTKREYYTPIIANTIREFLKDGKLPADVAPIRKALRERCPVYPKKFYPYRVWLDEIKVQLGGRKPRLRGRPPSKPLAFTLPHPDQGELWGSINFELRLIEAIMRHAQRGAVAASIHPVTKDLLAYAELVRIIEKAGQGKTPEQIRRYLMSDRKRAARQADERDTDATAIA